MNVNPQSFTRVSPNFEALELGKEDTYTDEADSADAVRIRIEGNRLLIEGFATNDSLIVDILRQYPQEELPAKIELALSLGVKMLQVATSTLDLSFVQDRFNNLQTEFKQGLESSRSQLEQALGQHLDHHFGDNGKMPQLLQDTQQAYNLALNEAQQELLKSLNTSFDLNKDESFLSVVLKKIEEAKSNMIREVGEISARLEATKKVREKTTLKGTDYEDTLENCLINITRGKQDHYERTSTTRSKSGSLKGDFVATINSQDFQDLRIVIEAKNVQNYKREELLDYLKTARQERLAEVAIAVLANLESKAAGYLPFQECGDGLFICVLDKESPDPLALEITYHIARFAAIQRRKASLVSSFKPEELVPTVKTINDQLSRIEGIKTNLGRMRKSLLDTEEDLGRLKNEIENTIRLLLNKLEIEPQS